MAYSQPVTSAAVLDALRKVTDPGSGKDLVSLGLVANVRVQQGKVSFDVYLPSHAVSHQDAMRAACIQAVKAIPGVSAVMPNFFQKPKPRVVHGQQAVPGVNHVIVVGSGKGGVGKTSVALRIARALSERGNEVLLTTTDPAGNVLDAAADLPTNLKVAQIDPVAEVAKYTRATLEKAKQVLDGDALALLEEDLRSPCTEEIAVFRAFAEAVAEGEERVEVRRDEERVRQPLLGDRPQRQLRVQDRRDRARAAEEDRDADQKPPDDENEHFLNDRPAIRAERHVISVNPLPNTNGFLLYFHARRSGYGAGRTSCAYVRSSVRGV